MEGEMIPHGKFRSSLKKQNDGLSNYKIGDKCNTGQVINVILGKTSDLIVFITSDNELRYEIISDKINDINTKLIAKTHQLLSIIKSSVPKKHQSNAKIKLGYALFTSINSDKNPIKIFEDVENFINLKCIERTKIFYILSSSFFVFIILIASLILNEMSNYKPFIVGAFAGSLGALISLLQRNKYLKIDPFSYCYSKPYKNSYRSCIWCDFYCCQ